MPNKKEKKHVTKLQQIDFEHKLHPFKSFFAFQK
jgi:hypothetical protein